jgi:hypothetical protein
MGRKLTMKKHLVRAALAFAALAATQAGAAPITDPAGDFLGTYTGPQAGDLDVISSEVIYNTDANTLTFNATLNAPINTTANVLLVWGVDRGAGTEQFLAGTPPIGNGVFFDSVFVAVPTAGVGVVNLLNGSPNTTLPGILQINGSSISATISAVLLPSTGDPLTAYSWNLWPRLGQGSNNQVADFAPNPGAVPGVSTNALVTVVPEPASAGLLALGLISFAAWRRRAR